MILGKANLPVTLHLPNVPECPPYPHTSSGNTIWSSAKSQFASEPRKLLATHARPPSRPLTPTEPEIDTTIDTIDTLNTKREQVGAAAANGHANLAIRQHYQTINGPIEAS